MVIIRQGFSAVTEPFTTVSDRWLAVILSAERADFFHVTFTIYGKFWSAEYIIWSIKYLIMRHHPESLQFFCLIYFIKKTSFFYTYKGLERMCAWYLLGALAHTKLLMHAKKPKHFAMWKRKKLYICTYSVK